jgi:tRNA A-37 threonylcarbamoyl transferase component Bud32
VRRWGDGFATGSEKTGISVQSLASVELSGVFATSQDALRRRLVGPWALGLRQYLAIRLGSMERAAEAFRELHRQFTAMPIHELLREPGPKAHAYRLARRIARDRLARGGEDPASAIVFRDPPDASRGYAEAIRRVRCGLSPEDAELVELRYARELAPAEIACVFEEPLADVEARLETAAARVRDLLGAYAPEPCATRGGPLVDVFALPKWKEDPTRAIEPDVDGALEPGTRIGGRYRIVKRVGVGAFGDVYEAEDADVSGHRVALKILREPSLSQAAREAVLREVKLIAAVFHPSVVQFKDHGWHQDRLWFVMPWYEGETLERRMRRGKLSRPEARRIFEALARALATLHAHGIRHQDVKPDNVFLARVKSFGGDGGESVVPVLLDLGVAAREYEALIGGTPVYFAPEVAAHYAGVEDDRPIGPKADVFALALSLRNALEPETEEDVPAGAIEAFIERRARQSPSPPRAKELRWLSPYFERWLSVDPDQRPSAEEFARELAVLTLPEERAARRRAVAQWLVPAVFGFGAAFAALVYVFVRENELQQREIHRARMEAAKARADQMVEAARLQALDADHAALIERYEQSRMTREQLASQLATAEGQVSILAGRIASLIADRDTLRAALEDARAELRRAQESAASLRGQLDIETQRTRDLGRYLDELRADSERITAELEADLEAARARVRILEEQLEQARVDRREAIARAEAREQQMRALESERDRAVQELAELRARVAQLRQVLEARPASARPEPGPTVAREEVTARAETATDTP